MAKKPSKSGNQWSDREVSQLRKEAKSNTLTRVIDLHLDRSEAAIRSKASEEAISLKPVNQSPYDRRKK